MYDRPYMTTNFEEQAKKPLYWIIGINIAVFVLQNIVAASGATDFFQTYFAFRRGSLGDGFLWAPLTYSFLHSTTSFLHIIFNMLGVFFLGRAIVPILGAKRFVQLYFGTVILGGLLWWSVSFLSNAPAVVGASAAVFGLLAFFASVYPNRDIQVLLFFVIPITVKPKILAWVMLGISGLGLIFQEILDPGAYVAHSAHLGGMLGGYLFYRFVYAPNPYASTGGLNISIPKLFKKSEAKSRTENYRYSVNVSQPKDLKKEVDRILDKINSNGFGSLTPDEKRVLDEARDLLRKR